MASNHQTVIISVKADLGEFQRKLDNLRDQVEDLNDSIDHVQRKINEAQADIAYLEEK